VTPTQKLPYVDVRDLRVGMFVHLDMSWLAHPFPLSSFRIADLEQIATLQGLGRKRLRWNPQLSAVDDVTPAAAREPITSESAARQHRRAQLAAERAMLAVCERQFTEATLEVSALVALAATSPGRAGERARELARTMAAKMAGSANVCIRLLPDEAGDKISNHAVNVGVLSLVLGKALGWDHAELLDLGVAGLMHDIGKLALPAKARDMLSCKTKADIDLYKSHVASGVAVAEAMGLSPSAQQAIAGHHEMADGSGFPSRTRNEHLGVAARVLAVVNRFDNLCNTADAARALTPHEALSQVFTRWAKQHDATILGALIDVMGIYPAGTVVQLTDERLAIVVEVNSSRSTAPRVLVHDPALPDDEALFIDLDRRAGPGIVRAVRPDELSREAFAYLRPRRRLAYHCESVAEAHDTPMPGPEPGPQSSPAH
jgi:putative nucleotidyltransferase with HDIG domain